LPGLHDAGHEQLRDEALIRSAPFDAPGFMQNRIAGPAKCQGLDARSTMNPRRVKSAGRLGVALAALASAAAFANPFPDADLANGKELHDSKRCAACHTEKTSRDEAFIYQRSERKVKSLFDLRRYVSLCNMELKLELFPEDERDVAAFVNERFYKLTK
jgi:mono/diheme cytochrome c family protein